MLVTEKLIWSEEKSCISWTDFCFSFLSFLSGGMRVDVTAQSLEIATA